MFRYLGLLGVAAITSAIALARVVPADAASVATGLSSPAGTVHTVRYGGHNGSFHGGPRFYGGGYRYGFYAPVPLYVAPSGCGWLRVRALDTGSRYWWHRYHDCRGY